MAVPTLMAWLAVAEEREHPSVQALSPPLKTSPMLSHSHLYEREGFTAASMEH